MFPDYQVDWYNKFRTLSGHITFTSSLKRQSCFFVSAVGTLNKAKAPERTISFKLSAITSLSISNLMDLVQHFHLTRNSYHQPCPLDSFGIFFFSLLGQLLGIRKNSNRLCHERPNGPASDTEHDCKMQSYQCQ